MRTTTTIVLLAMAVACVQGAPAPQENADEIADIKKFNPSAGGNGGGYYPSVYDSSYNPAGYNPSGYNPSGYNPSGYNPSGYNPSGYNPSGYNPALFGGDSAAFDPFSAIRPWKLEDADSHRQKREVCWFGQKACTMKCKFFGRGATQGRCLNGYCECFYPGQYPGFPGFSGH